MKIENVTMKKEQAKAHPLQPVFDAVKDANAGDAIRISDVPMAYQGIREDLLAGEIAAAAGRAVRATVDDGSRTPTAYLITVLA